MHNQSQDIGTNRKQEKRLSIGFYAAVLLEFPLQGCQMSSISLCRFWWRLLAWTFGAGFLRGSFADFCGIALFLSGFCLADFGVCFTTRRKDLTKNLTKNLHAPSNPKNHLSTSVFKRSTELENQIPIKMSLACLSCQKQLCNRTTPYRKFKTRPSQKNTRQLITSPG